jgi:molybdopterin biosynthesis enzyme MoaB
LIVNVPGSVRGARENLAALARTLPHAIALLNE